MILRQLVLILALASSGTLWANSDGLNREVRETFKGTTESEMVDVRSAFNKLQTAKTKAEKKLVLEELANLMAAISKRTLSLSKSERTQENIDLAIITNALYSYLEEHFPQGRVDRKSCERKSSGLNFYQEQARHGLYDLEASDPSIRKRAEREVRIFDFIINQVCE
jgi:hypothetical protein